MTARDEKIRRRPVATRDAQAVGAVFDAAVRTGWTYLGEIVQSPMFTPDEWDADVAAHRGPDAMLVAVDAADLVVGFTAVHPRDCEMYLLFVHPDVSGRGIGRLLLEAAHDVLRSHGCAVSQLYTHEQ